MIYIYSLVTLLCCACTVTDHFEKEYVNDGINNQRFSMNIFHTYTRVSVCMSYMVRWIKIQFSLYARSIYNTKRGAHFSTKAIRALVRAVVLFILDSLVKRITVACALHLPRIYSSSHMYVYSENIYWMVFVCTVLRWWRTEWRHDVIEKFHVINSFCLPPAGSKVTLAHAFVYNTFFFYNINEYITSRMCGSAAAAATECKLKLYSVRVACSA